MTQPLSDDLRRRVIRAVGQGMSCRAAAERFGVAASTAVKLVRRWRTQGTAAPRPQGGDRRSDRIEAFAPEVLGLIADRADITLAEIAEHLVEVHGERFAPSTIWRCLDRHKLTFKKNSARQRAGTARRRRCATGLVRKPGHA